MASTITQINKINQIISENIEDPILILNEKFMCEYANFEDFKEEKHIFDFIHPDDKKRVNKFIKNIFKHGFGTEESRIIDDKGFFRWYEIKGKRFLDDTNNRRVFLICRDISKFKKIEENYNESQKSFSELADSLPEIRYWKFIQSKEGVTTVQKTREMLDLVCDNIPHFIYWKDINLVYIGCNKNFALMNGLEEGSNIIGRTDNDLIWLKNNIETIQENERRVMKNNIPELNSVASFITKDGNQVWFEINRIPLHDLKGKVVGILSTYEDITIRKTAEEKLKESEEKYRGILDTIKEGYFEVDINGKFTFFNDALCELHGYTNEEMLGVNYQTFVDETNKQKIIEVYTEVYQTGNPKFDFQYQLRNKNGELITCETSIYLRHDINGKIVGFSGFLRDITEKFILEQKIKESEENYRTIFNSSPDYIYVTDVEGNLLEANQSLLDRIGIPLEELRETNFMQYFAGDDLEGLMEISQGLTLGKEIKGIEVRAKNVHGEIFEYEINAVPLKTNGEITKVLNLARDITAKKYAEQRLKDSEKKYRHLFESSPYSIWLMDEDGIIVDCNSTINSLLSVLKIEDIIGKKFSEVLTFLERPDDLIILLKERFDKFLKGDRLGPLEFQITRLNGIKIWLSIQTSIVNIGGKRLTQAIIQDITDLKESEEELRILNEELEQIILERTKELRESEEKYRTLTEQSFLGIAIVQDDIVQYVNNQLANKFGYTVQEIMAWKKGGFLNIIYPEDRKLVAEQARKKQLGESDVTNQYQFRGIKKNGDIIWLETFSKTINYRGKPADFATVIDISDRIFAEQKLMESERKFRHLYENSPYGIVLLNSEGTIIDINSTVPMMFGFDKKDLIGNNYFTLIGVYSSDTMSTLRELPAVLSRRRTLYSNVIPKITEIYKKDGTRTWVQSEISTIELDDEIIHQVIIQDITEKRNAEEKLRVSERQYRTTIDSLGDPLHVVDKDLRIILVNKEFQKWLDDLNIDKQIIGKKIFEAFPFLTVKVRNEYQQVFDNGILVTSMETNTLDDHDVVTETRKIPIFSEGEIEQVITIIRDITENKEMENQLKKSEEKYRNMVNNLDVGFYKGEYKDKLLMHNQAVNRILRLKPDESLVGVKSSQFFINEETRKRYYDELDEKGFIRNLIAQVKKRDRDIITVNFNAHIIYDSEGEPVEVEGTFTDITEKFKLEQELLESEKKLREQNIELMKLDQIKNDFITMAAHELKTPLISISGYTDYILMKHRTSFTPEITEDLLTVQRNVKRLEVLMDQLLEVMKIDEDKLELQKEQINVRMIINDCLDDLSYLINEKNLEIILNINHEITLNVDTSRIFTVFTNLVSNAIKFTPDYGWVEISAEKSKDGYIFKVKDNGIGLNEEELGKLFKKFERIKQPILNENSNVKDNGTGLGLYITKGIVELHGGEIHADSEGPNKGTTFTFTLPI